MSESEILENIKKETKRIMEDCEYSAKGHFESAKYWRYGNYALMVASIASVCLSLSFVSGIFAWGVWLSILSAFIAILLIFLNPQEKYLSHQNIGNKYLALRNKARIFLEVESKNVSIERQIESLNKLDSKRSKLNNISLPISQYGYESAKKQIEVDRNTQYQVNME